MDTITKKIAGYASSLSFNNLDEATRHAATQRLIDALGCGLGAHDCEPAQIGRRLSAGETPGKYAGPRAVLRRTGCRRNRPAFINTAMIRNFDFNDRYPGGHPSDALGPLIALASAMPVDGRRFLARHERDVRDLRAAVAIRRSSAGAAGTRAFAISISAAAGVCNLLGLPLQATANAIGIAATFERAAARHALGRAHALEERRHRLCGAQRAVRGAASPPKAWRGRAMRSRDGQGCSRTSPGRSRSRISRPRAARR